MGVQSAGGQRLSGCPHVVVWIPQIEIEIKVYVAEDARCNKSMDLLHALHGLHAFLDWTSSPIIIHGPILLAQNISAVAELSIYDYFNSK